MTDYSFEKKLKTCVIKNETIGGLTFGLICSKFLPIIVSVPNEENRYLLKQNIPSLSNVVANFENDKYQDEVDIFAYNIPQKETHKKDKLDEIYNALEVIEKTNYKNYIIVSNVRISNPKSEIGLIYKQMSGTLSERGMYTQIERMYYKEFGGSEYRINTFVIGTQNPSLLFENKRNKVSYAKAATVDYLRRLKKRNGYPENWQLDLLNDAKSFRDQIRKMEVCVLPSLVKIIADTIYMI